ncbi:hypothetical protein RIF29_28333 [Crotalaria pallida]|uniref:Uncharacterized protein n=1 Tax=Crotalaria pallida TaxID=3830 RepID=A0AAN9EVI8_CROPI
MYLSFRLILIFKRLLFMFLDDTCKLNAACEKYLHAFDALAQENAEIDKQNWYMDLKLGELILATIFKSQSSSLNI